MLFSFWSSLPCFSVTSFFSGGFVEQETRDPHFNSRKPHGFAQELRKGIEYGHAKHIKPAAAMVQSDRRAAG